MNGRPGALIERVNLIYHELEASRYARAHPEIYRGERARWIGLLRWAEGRIGAPARIVDLASGAGFVAEAALEAGIAIERMVLSDLSPAMLAVARERLARRAPAGRFEFRVCAAEAIGEPDSSVDIVTANSALHHFPDLPAVFSEIQRVLKPGGVFLAAHEPNRRFWDPDGPSRYAEAWKRRLQWLRVYGNPWRYARKALRVAGLVGPRRPEAPLEELTAEQCARQGLFRDGRPIQPRDIPSLVDCHVPHPGTPAAESVGPVGFAPAGFGPTWFPGWSVERLEVYGHLEDLAWRRRWLAPVERRLALRYPGQGCHFSLALIKPACRPEF